MAEHENSRRIHLPRGWHWYVKSVVLHVIALGQNIVACTRSREVNGWLARVRPKAEKIQLRQDVAVCQRLAGVRPRRWLERQLRQRPVPQWPWLDYVLGPDPDGRRMN